MGHDHEPGEEGEQHADDAQAAADPVAAPHRLDRRDDRVVHEPDDDQQRDDRRVLDILLRLVDEGVEQNAAGAEAESAEKTEGEHRDYRFHRLVTFPASDHSHPRDGMKFEYYKDTKRTIFSWNSGGDGYASRRQ